MAEPIQKQGKELCLITGADRGLGFALTHQALLSGYRVLALHRREVPGKSLQELQKRYSEDLICSGGWDLSHICSIKEISPEVSNIITRELKYIFHVAGVSAKYFDNSKKSTAKIGHLNIHHFREMFEVNTFAPLFLSQTFFNFLITSKYKGHCWIVHISSRDGSFSVTKQPGNYAYCSSKAALNMFTKYLALELSEKKIGGVISLHPGWVNTDMGGSDAELSADESSQKILGLVKKLTLQQNGLFLNIDASTHPF